MSAEGQVDAAVVAAALDPGGLRRILEDVPAAVVVTDMRRRVAFWNREAVALFGWTPEEALGKSVLELFVRPEDPIMDPEVRQKLARGERFIRHYEARRKDGAQVAVTFALAALRDQRGETIGVVGVSLDRTELASSERALHRREAEASLVADLAHQAVAEPDLQALARASASGVARMLDVPYVGLLELLPDGKTFVLRVGVGLEPEAEGNLTFGPDVISNRARSVMATGEPTVAADILADEGPRPLLVEHYGVRSGALALVGTPDRPIGLLAAYGTRPGAVGEEAKPFMQAVAGVLGNAIQRRRSQDELERAERLQALGRLAGGIAHDFNNQLTVMLGNLELIAAQAGSAGIASAVEQAREAGREAAALVDQLVSFSRGGERSSHAVDINEVLRACRDHTAPAPGVEVSFSLTAGHLLVDAPEKRLRQALDSLIVNAIEAMPSGGVLGVESIYVHADVARAQGLENRPFACVVVSDTGPGMDPETVSHLFEPYFTTKQPPAVRGLGLPATYGIVTEAGGRLDVRTQPGAGTTMTLWWPVASSQPPPAGSAAVAVEREQDAPAGATVLLVEDQASIRSLLASVLRDRGFGVLEAGGGGQALDLAASASRLDLIVTDLGMPEIDGRDVVERLLPAHPDAAVLYMSGLPPEASLGPEEARTAFLRKPFGIAEFLQTAARLLGLE